MINYGGIPDEVLDITIGEGYDSSWTLRSELDKIGEDIIHVDYEMYNNSNPGEERIKFFTAYTNSFVLCLINTVFGDQCILDLPRNPPTK